MYIADYGDLSPLRWAGDGVGVQSLACYGEYPFKELKLYLLFTDDRHIFVSDSRLCVL